MVENAPHGLTLTHGGRGVAVVAILVATLGGCAGGDPTASLGSASSSRIESAPRATTAPPRSTVSLAAPSSATGTPPPTSTGTTADVDTPRTRTTTTVAPTTTRGAPQPEPDPPSTPAEPELESAADCHPHYGGCVPIASDVDCEGGSGNGPAYVRGPVEVTGEDVYGLDADDDGIGCEA